MIAEQISNTIRTQNISEVLHFTTSNGLIGILSSRKTLSHSELPSEETLEYITQLNCPDRNRDNEWHAYVNLSVSRVNGSFFKIARNKWHATKDLFWCVLSFDPEIMTHSGVIFSTTNNAYPETIRTPGHDGLQSLFNPKVRQFSNKWVHRAQNTPAHHTTCHQAEVLYPKSVSNDYLRKVYVPSHEIHDEVSAQISVCARSESESFELVVDPQHFE